MSINGRNGIGATRERYQLLFQSDNMAAGLGAAATIASFRWTSTTHIAVIKEIVLTSLTNTTAFSAGNGEIMLYPVTAFTVADSGSANGTPAKLRTSYTASRVAGTDIWISQTAATTAGTRTVGANIGGYYVAFDATANKQWLAGDGHRLLDSDPNDPEDGLILKANEGWIARATVPASGVWRFAIRCKWEEREGVI